MPDHPTDKQKAPPPGVTFMRDVKAKDAEFKQDLQGVKESLRKEGSLTPAWEEFFDKALGSDSSSETLLAEFLKLLSAQDVGNRLSEEETEALLACINSGQEPP